MARLPGRALLEPGQNARHATTRINPVNDLDKQLRLAGAPWRGPRHRASAVSPQPGRARRP
eukprot:11210764-Lingulodinium_polyedra.AAC.1